MFINIKKLTILLSFVMLLALSGCSSMPTTEIGFPSEEQHHVLVYEKALVNVIWLEKNNKVTHEEQTVLMKFLESEIQIALKAKNINLQDSNIRVRAAITRVETIAPVLNWISTILFIIPFDRGGAAVEFEAINLKTNSVVVEMNFAEWTPLSEFKARFSRLAPAELALQSSAYAFVSHLLAETKQ